MIEKISLGKTSRLVFGVGINDSVSPTSKRVEIQKINGKRKQKLVWTCPFYSKWKDMLMRCYSDKYKEKHPTYEGCTVCEDWLIFSKFKYWMERQDWEGKHLDKDILVEGNKIYSPETCIFVDHRINCFILDKVSQRGNYPIGVHWSKQNKKFASQISENGKVKSLGFFNTPEEAHLAWRKAKYEQAIILVSELDDSRIIDVILKRYSTESNEIYT